MRKRPKLFYYTSFFCICSLTAFVAYFVLLRDVEQNSFAIAVPSGRIGKEISDRLVALESGLRENRALLDNVCGILMCSMPYIVHSHFAGTRKSRSSVASGVLGPRIRPIQVQQSVPGVIRFARASLPSWH